MNVKIDIAHIEYTTTNQEIDDIDFKKGWKEFEDMLNNYLKLGVMPRIGEKLVGNYNYAVIIDEICYCDNGRIMVDCNCA